MIEQNMNFEGLEEVDGTEEICGIDNVEEFNAFNNKPPTIPKIDVYSVPGDSVILYTNLNTQVSTHT